MDIPKPQPPKKPVVLNQKKDRVTQNRNNRSKNANSMNEKLRSKVLALKGGEKPMSNVNIAKQLGVPESTVRAALRPRKAKSREVKTKRPFVKKAHIYDVLGIDGTTKAKIYADTVEEASEIFKGIHKMPATTVVQRKREFALKDHLAHKPFEGLSTLIDGDAASDKKTDEPKNVDDEKKETVK